MSQPANLVDAEQSPERCSYRSLVAVFNVTQADHNYAGPFRYCVLDTEKPLVVVMLRRAAPTRSGSATGKV
jgi:hypothetical protein